MIFKKLLRGNRDSKATDKSNRLVNEIFRQNRQWQEKIAEQLSSRNREATAEIDRLANEISRQNREGQEKIAEQLANLEDSTRKLGRNQYRANTVAEAERQELKNILQQAISLTVEPQKDMLHEFLRIIDGLEEGLRAVREIKSETSIMTWAIGFCMVHERMIQFLQRWNVVPIDCLGKKFDPRYHQAVDVSYVSEGEPEDIIVDEQCRGYLWGDEVLRYAQVVVSKRG